MPKIDQYLNYVESYTKISKTTSLCIPIVTIDQPSEHLYRSLIGRATTVCSCAVFLISIELQWRFLQIHDDTADFPSLPLVHRE
jgi:hypothetical protein